jgi:hypothetical protein
MGSRQGLDGPMGGWLESAIFTGIERTPASVHREVQVSFCGRNIPAEQTSRRKPNAYVIQRRRRACSAGACVP